MTSFKTMTRASMIPPAKWPIGTALCITDKLVLPVVAHRCCDPDYVITDADLVREITTLFPPERLILQRLINQARHAICLHAGVTLVVIGTRYLKPLETDA